MRKFINTGRKINSDYSALVGLDNFLYVFWGHNLDECWVYDYDRHRWELLPPMKERRYYCRATLVKEKIYVTEGLSVDVFDCKTRLWPSGPRIKKCQSYVIEI